MKYTWNQLYGVTKKMLSCSGQWPYHRRRTRLFRVTLLSAITISLIVPQVAKFIQCNRNLQCILATVPSTLLTNMILVKLYSCQFNGSKIKNLTDHLRSNWEELATREEYRIMKTYAAKAKRFALIYSIFCLISSAIFIFIIPLVPQILNFALPLNESRPLVLPYEAYYFVDERDYFGYIITHNFLALEISMTGLLAHDCMLLTYVEHVCSIFAVAGYCFENLVYEQLDRINNNTDDMYNKKIAILVHTHWRALDFADLLENAFYIPFAVQIAIVTIGLSITLLQIALQSDDSLEATRYISFVIAQVIHLFCFSLQGQRLMDHSQQMRDKIYNCSWYKIPVKSQRSLLYVMKRSLQPNVLSAGKIYIFSLKSFTTVVQTSLSYFTVLASFQ